MFDGWGNGNGEDVGIIDELVKSLRTCLAEAGALKVGVDAEVDDGLGGRKGVDRGSICM